MRGVNIFFFHCHSCHSLLSWIDVDHEETHPQFVKAGRAWGVGGVVLRCLNENQGKC